MIKIKIKNMCFLVKSHMFKFRGGGVCTQFYNFEIKLVHLNSNGYMIPISQYDGDNKPKYILM